MGDLHKELEKRLNEVREIFGVGWVLSVKSTTESIARYYRINRLAYSLFHNPHGFVHMGISRDLKYSHDDLLEQPKLVAKYIKELGAHNVLELATGKGASSVYLAKLFPDVNFDGIDLPGGQLDVAQKAARRVPNFSSVEGDYHNLSIYSDNYFDVVFVIESLCHSTKKEIVAGEVWRVLKDGGVFIIVDGYTAGSRELLGASELLAVRLAERGMAVNEFEVYDDVKNKILRAGFEVIHEEDASQPIVPSLKRFERLAKMTVFNHPRFGRFIVKLLPDEFTFNAISGFLMPLLVELGVAKYMILVVRKKG